MDISDGSAEPPLAALRSPLEILFGEGQRAALGWAVRDKGVRAFICADPHIARSTDFAEILKLIQGSGVDTLVYSDIVPELPTDHIETAVYSARSFDTDVLVAIGGGSSIDLAKVVAVLLSHGGMVSDYYGEFAVPGVTLPVIAVPTTAGTGSEVTPVAVVTDVERGRKVGLSSPYIIPAVAICDPQLTYSCPPSVTASAGADALSHCIEAYTATRRTADAGLARERVFVGSGPITDALALIGIRHLVAGLQPSYLNPTDAMARRNTMYGALMAGLAFGTAGTAAAHALQYPIGALTHTPHGVGVGVLLPYVIEFNRGERVPELAEIARIFGAEDDTEEELAVRAPELVAGYLAALGIPRTLAEIGLDESELSWAATQGAKPTRLSENNPKSLTETGAHLILAAAHAGDFSIITFARDLEGTVP